MENVRRLPQKPYHPLHTLIDRTPQELDELEAAGEISSGDVVSARWRKGLIAKGLGTATADTELERYYQMKKQKAEAATATKE